MDIKVGDKIRDIEDGDCYFEGIVESISDKTMFYRVTKAVWNGEVYEEQVGRLEELKWWKLEKI